MIRADISNDRLPPQLALHYGYLQYRTFGDVADSQTRSAYWGPVVRRVRDKARRMCIATAKEMRPMKQTNYHVVNLASWGGDPVFHIFNVRPSVR